MTIYFFNFSCEWSSISKAFKLLNIFLNWSLVSVKWFTWNKAYHVHRNVMKSEWSGISRNFYRNSGDLEEANRKFSAQDLSVNCHRVSPYSPPELVLSTPLGTFHRMPLTSWFTDPHQSSLDRGHSRTSNFESALIMERGSSSSSSSSSSNVNQLHPKKKVGRIFFLVSITLILTNRWRFYWDCIACVIL